eukprot:SAG22_NODE_560_length_9102_cov_54.310785_13_plen_134_part_00
MKKEMEEMQKKMEALEMEKQQRQQAGGSSGDDADQDDPTITATVYKSNTLEMIKKLPSAEYDLLYTNPPFGTTGAAWDILFYRAVTCPMDETRQQVAVVGAVGMNFIAVCTLVIDFDEILLKYSVLSMFDFRC